MSRNKVLDAIRAVHDDCEAVGAFGRCSTCNIPLAAEICDAGIALRAMTDAGIAGDAAALLPSFREHYRNATRPGELGPRGTRVLDVAAVRNAVHAVKRAVRHEYAGRDEAFNLSTMPSERVKWHRALPRLERQTREARADLIAVLERIV